MNSEGFEVFDWATWAAIVRNLRKKQGYSAAEDFARRVWLETRVKLTRETIYKIEGGKQQPTVEQFWAINLMLFGTLMPDEKILALCLSGEWSALADCVGRGEHEIPDAWRRENTETVTNEYLLSHKSLPQWDEERTYSLLSSFHAAGFSNSPRSLFSKMPGEDFYFPDESTAKDEPPF